MDIIEAYGGGTNYDEVDDAEPIVIDGIPYMVMGHAQYYVDSRILHSALGADEDVPKVYEKFVSNNTIDYNQLLDDIVTGSGLHTLLTRHIDTLGTLWRMLDEYDDVKARTSTSGKVPERPPTRPNALTPADLRTWAMAIAGALTSRGIKVPKFKYPRKCNWITETSQPTHKVSAKTLMEADMICCRYVECLEASYVYVAKYISDLQDALATSMKKLK